MARLFVQMHKAGIRPVVVFDGRPPVAKAAVVESRRIVREVAHKEMEAIRAELTESTHTEMQRAVLESRVAALQRQAPRVTNNEKDELKSFLYAAGVQFVTAAGEADDVLAHLCRTGYITGVVSTDMDMLARGVPVLVVPETADATVLTEIRQPNLLTTLGLTYDQFVTACTLMGTDYTDKSWRSVEPRAAIEQTRAGVDLAVLDTSGHLVAAAARLRGDGIVWEEIVSERQRTKWALGVPEREPLTVAAFGAKYGWPSSWVRALACVE